MNYAEDLPLEIKQSPENLQTSETRYRRLFESSLDGILILDAITRKITDVNPFMMELLGYSREEFIDKELWEIGVLRDKTESVAAFIELQMKDYIRYDNLPLITRNGVRREVEFVSNVYTEKGREVIQCNIRDNTTRNAGDIKTRLIERAIGSIVEGILICDVQQPDYPCIYTNAAFEKITGYTFEEVEGRDFLFLHGRETNPKTAEEIKEALKNGKMFRGEILNYQKNGTPFWNDLRISPVFDKRGKLTNFVAVLQDITERKNAEEWLKISEARFRLLCDSAPLGVFLADKKGDFLYVNHYLQKTAMLSFDECLNFGWVTIIHPEDREQILNEWKTAAENGIECFQQYRYLPGDGITRWVKMRTVPNYTAEGHLVSHVGTVEDITERINAEESLSLAEIKYRNIVESLPAIIYRTELDPPYLPKYVSPNVEKLGYTLEEWFNSPDIWMRILHEEDRERVIRTVEVAMSQNLETDLEYRIVARDGTVFWVHDKGHFVFDEKGAKTAWQGVMLDISATKELEKQLRLAQKLESVGMLTGGIAHDFNNMLTVINCYSDLTLRKLTKEDPLRQNIEEIKKAGQRSAELTHQLLAFSRQQIMEPIVTNLNEIIVDTTKMLQRLIGEDIQLTTSLNSKIGQTIVDPGQFSQIIMNLTVNARDAMPQGGKLTIETANVFLDDDYTRRHVGFLPGAYVMLAVSDNGSGMNEKIKQHIFEPFFTTKALGRGTGLGLATVYGIVKQSGGNIEVYSEQGIGTTFKIYLPRVNEEVEKVKTPAVSLEMLMGTETILLVEDEFLVRNLSKKILETCGYRVIEAGDGLEALELCQQDSSIDLLMTDVVMPKMGGRELSEKLSEIFPKLKILYTSGYTDDAVVRHGVIGINKNFIQKPFTPEALSTKIRAILDNSL